MADPTAIPVAVTGVTWTGVGVWTGVLTLIGVIVRAWPVLQRQRNDATAVFRDDLMERVVMLESKRETEQAEHAADLATLRHQLNNVTQCLDSLLMLIEQDPNKAADAAARIRAMRAEQRRTESVEKATIRGAKITAAANRAEPEA